MAFGEIFLAGRGEYVVASGKMALYCPLGVTRYASQEAFVLYAIM